MYFGFGCIGKKDRGMEEVNTMSNGRFSVLSSPGYHQFVNAAKSRPITPIVKPSTYATPNIHLWRD